MISEQQLKEWQHICDFASEAPWELEDDSANGRDEFYGLFHRVGNMEMLGEKCGHDELFVAVSRTAVPALIAEVRRLQKEYNTALDLLIKIGEGKTKISIATRNESAAAMLAMTGRGK